MMRRTFHVCLVAAVLCGPAWAQSLPTPPAPTPPISLVGSTAVPASGMAVLSLSGSYSSAAWLVFPDRTTGAQVVSSYLVQLPNPGSTFLFAGKPGNYDVAVFAVTPSGASSLQTVVTIQPGILPPTPLPPNPPPPNPPPPNPPPTPPSPPTTPIVTGRAWAIAVFDVRSASYTAPGSTQPSLRTSGTLEAALADPQTAMVWRPYDVTSDVVQQSRWGKALAGKSLPVLAIIDTDGNAVAIVPLPADEAGIVSVARKARGLTP